MKVYDLNNKFLSDSFLLLRALEPEDLDVLYKWENNPEWWYCSTTKGPLSRYVLKQYIQESHKDIYENKQLRLMIISLADNSPIGMIDLYDFDAYNKKAEVGILIDPQFQQKGFGSRALSLLNRYAFSFLKIHQLYAYIPEENISSIQLFSSCGYKTSGKLQDWISSIDGFSNIVLMQCVSED